MKQDWEVLFGTVTHTTGQFHEAGYLYYFAEYITFQSIFHISGFSGFYSAKLSKKTQ